MKARALVTREKGNAGKIEEIEIPEPKGTEVVVKMVGCGVCHTDGVAIDQNLPTPLPAVMGHEGSGIVERVGSEVTEVKPGDKVILAFPWCGKCETCMTGHPAQCEQTVELSFLGVFADGKKRLADKHGTMLSSFFCQSSFATHAITDVKGIVKIADDATLDELASYGPLGCGLETGTGTIMNVLRAKPGSSIAVFGCGAVGMAAIMGAKIAGCINIIGIDLVDSRLKLAKELGATHVINGKQGDTVNEIRKITGGKGVEYSLENTATPACINQALECLRPFGVCASVGSTGNQRIPIVPQDQLNAGQRTLMGVVQGDVRPKEWLPKLIQWHKQGKLPFDRLIKYYDFTEDGIAKAFADSHSGVTIKPVIRF